MAEQQAQMWTAYRFNGFDVRVIQKWRDPYGKAMVRVAAIDDPERAQGLLETEFLATAAPLGDMPAADD